MKRTLLAYSIRFLVGILIPNAAHGEPCEFSTAKIMIYEHEILSLVQKDEKKTEELFWKKGLKPLMCLLEIHQVDDGALKYFAEAFLKPILGAPQPDKVEKDPRYAQLAKILHKSTLQSQDLLDRSWVSRFAKGSWGLYEGFCNSKSHVDCKYFVPDEKLIGAQAPMVAATSMLLLRTAYYNVDGKSREEIGDRIKVLYRTTPKNRQLERRMIEAIYTEIFVNKKSLV